MYGVADAGTSCERLPLVRGQLDSLLPISPAESECVITYIVVTSLSVHVIT